MIRLLVTLDMLKKKLGIEAIERGWLGIRCLKDYFRISSTLTIPEGCERVGYRAFWGYVGLEKVIILDSVTEIGDWAFCGCKNATITLKKLKEEFKYIGSGALVGCKDVKEETGD